MNFKKVLLFLLPIIFVLISLRISQDKSIWRDEAFSYFLSSKSIPDIISSTAKDFTPPLFYLLLHPLIKLFGPQKILLRILPLIFSLFNLLALFLLENHLSKIFKFKKIESYFFLILSTFCLPLIYFSTELRAYSLFMLLAFLSILFLYLFLSSQKTKHLIIFTIINILLLYSHNLSIFYLLSLSLASLLFLILKKDWQNLKKITLSLLISILFFAPWIKVILNQSQNFNNSFWIELTEKEIRQEYHGLFFINENYSDQDRKAIIFDKTLLLASYLTIIGFIYFSTQNKKNALFCLTFLFTILIFYLFSIFIKPILYQRYIAFLAPFSIVFIIFAFIGFNRQSKIFLFLLPLYLYFNYQIFNMYLKKPYKIDYSQLQNFAYPIYADEDITLMSCKFINNNCTYVGNFNEVPKYLGISQIGFENFNQINNWTEIKDDQFGALYWWEDKGLDKATDKNYKIIKTTHLGDGLQFSILTRN